MNSLTKKKESLSPAKNLTAITEQDVGGQISELPEEHAEWPGDQDEAVEAVPNLSPEMTAVSSLKPTASLHPSVSVAAASDLDCDIFGRRYSSDEVGNCAMLFLRNRNSVDGDMLENLIPNKSVADDNNRNVTSQQEKISKAELRKLAEEREVLQRQMGPLISSKQFLSSFESSLKLVFTGLVGTVVDGTDEVALSKVLSSGNCGVHPPITGHRRRHHGKM
jgi:hypothetical protein